MSLGFKLFTIDATGSPPDPDTASVVVSIPFPSSLVSGNTDSILNPPEGHGSVFQNFDGIIIQDFGITTDFAGGRIKFGDGPVLTAAQASSLYTLYSAVDTSYYFFDGFDTYKVKFSRSPVGYNFWRQYIVEESMGFTRYSYDVELVVEEKLS